MVQHKGEIIEKAVRESGMSITRLTAKMGKSRRWLYQIFEKPNVPMDYILEIGKIIHHDFTDEIKELKQYKFSMNVPRVDEQEMEFISESARAEHWKDKYLSLLEQYNALLQQLQNQGEN